MLFKSFEGDLIRERERKKTCQLLNLFLCVFFVIMLVLLSRCRLHFLPEDGGVVPSEDSAHTAACPIFILFLQFMVMKLQF